MPEAVILEVVRTPIGKRNGRRAVDPEQRKEKVKEAQRLIYEKGPTLLPIFTWVDFNVYHGFVRNFPNTRGLGTTGLFLSDWWLTL